MALVNPDTTTVAEMVRVEMARQDIGYKRLADMVQIPRTTLLRKIKGSSPFQVDELIRVARALGCSYREFLPEDVA